MPSRVRRRYHHAHPELDGEVAESCLYCSGAKYGTTLIIAPANISVLNDVFA
jgi:hypothetical protein